MGQDLLENDTAWPNPVWSPRLFQTSTLAKMLISWLVSSPNLDQVHRFKGSKRLAHCSVAELGEDSSSSSCGLLLLQLFVELEPTVESPWWYQAG